MSRLAETLIGSNKIAQLGRGGYITCDGQVQITDILDATESEPARLYFDQPLSVEQVHILLMAIFYPNIDSRSYQVNNIQSPLTNRPETEIIFQRTPVVVTQPGI